VTQWPSLPKEFYTISLEDLFLHTVSVVDWPVFCGV
jgi:hypothetical protein